GERGFVDADFRRRALALRRQRRVAGAARELLADAVARILLHGVEARRRAQPQVEPLGVDRLDFPGQAPRALATLGPGETGHALKTHTAPMRCGVRRGAPGREPYGARGRRSTPPRVNMGK